MNLQIHSVNLNDPVSCAATFRSNRNLGLIFWAFIVGAGLLTGTETKEREDTATVAAA